jgi:hypothetical protein
LNAGHILIAGQPFAGYRTRTDTGYVRQPKTGLDNAIDCSITVNTMKSVLNVGDMGGALGGTGSHPRNMKSFCKFGKRVDKIVGHPLEIVPLINPIALKVNDYLPFQVLQDGQPYTGFFTATYAGFSSEDDVFAYTAQTDEEGNGRLRILSRGIWLIKVESQEPYPDTSVCDTRKYRAVLTFHVD